MTFKKWAWDLFETTGNLEAFLALKEAETQEKMKNYTMEIGNLEMSDTQINGDIDGVNKN